MHYSWGLKSAGEVGHFFICYVKWIYSVMEEFTCDASVLVIPVVQIITTAEALLTVKQDNDYEPAYLVLKVSRSRNQIVEPQILPKNE